MGISSYTDSRIWKDINIISSEMMTNCFWKVGKGMIFFWSQKWWPQNLNISRPDNLPDILVKDVWNDNTRKQDYINQLPAALQNYARNITLSNSEDVLIWQQAEDGKFSAKKLRTQQGNREASAFSWWKNFWRDWIPSKCSCFLWKCLHHIVPVDEVIQRANVSLASKCVCCSSTQQENINHLFLFSDVAKDVWSFLHSIFDIQFQFMDIQQAAIIWINNSPVNSQLGCLRILAFVITLWEIWKWRNTFIYDKPVNPSTIKRNIVLHLQQCNFLIRPLKEATWTDKISISCLHLPVLKPAVRKGKWIHWSPNPQGFTLNFHGRIEGNTSSGGLIFRDSKGNNIYRNCLLLPDVKDLFLLNILVLEEALYVASSKNFNLVEIQGDSTKFLQSLSGGKSPPWEWIDRIEGLQKQCHGINLRKIEKEKNWVAVLLANRSDESTVRKAEDEDRRGLQRWSWV